MQLFKHSKPSFAYFENNFRLGIFAPHRSIGGIGWLIVFILTYSASFAQNGVIQGNVKDGEIPLPNATVVVADKTTMTDIKGEFSIQITSGIYKIIVTHAGYIKVELDITVTTGEIRTVRVSMVREEAMGEVVVLGSRSFIQRSNFNTPVPLDRISSKELKETGQPSLIQMLNFIAPSFNTSRQHLSDPVTMRGLSPDHLLILLNGVRYHKRAAINSGSIRGTLGRASVSNDLNSIPFSAIEKIEILRDGASAQYGSDGIAGVMNISLKKTTGKTFINLHVGQHYKGDGENLVFGLNHGFSLAKKGFLNVSGDFRYRNATHRGGEYQGTVYYSNPVLDSQRIVDRGFSRKTPVSNDGSIELSSGGLLVNGGYFVNNRAQFFWTALVNYRRPVWAGAYRFPKNPNQVNTALYPDGFKPTNNISSRDMSMIAGAKGKLRKNWNWEWNSAWGRNSDIFNWRHTNNASQFAMGANAPTNFYGGTAAFKQQTNSFALAKDFAKKISGVKTFNLGLGAEYGFENFRTRQGEQAAWANYDSTHSTQPGAQPSPGITPQDVVNEHRRVAGLYIDVESDLNDHLLVNIAGRFENYSDFGNNLAGKMAIRYKFSSSFSMRGSISNGYHAPGLQQTYFSATLTGFNTVPGNRGAPRLGIFNNNSSITKAFDVKPLQAEKALTLGSGFTSTLSPHVHLTVDAYWIQIRDRLVLSGTFERSNPQVNDILKNHQDIDQVQFMTNAINTRTYGVDLVMTGNWHVRKALVELTLAANFNRTKVFGDIQTTDKLPDSLNTNTLFNREEREKIERGQPASKIIFSASYKKGRVGFLIRSTRFGKTSAVFQSADRERDEFFSAKILTDFSINYSPRPWLNLTAGANNLFDVYPDQLKNPQNQNLGILIYSNEAMPFGYNGGYYFLAMSFSF